MPRAERSASALLATLRTRGRPYAPALVASFALGWLAVRGIEARAGHPALPLDDSFIHLQYAKRLAQGAFFSYVPGEGYTSGATSPLWPVVLAPAWLLGLRDLALVRWCWLLGTLAHAALAVETARLARRLAGEAVAFGAGALALVFGAFAWFAWSGMETVPFAWALCRTMRLAAEHFEPEATRPGTPPSARQLAIFGVVTPLLRPEGAVASLVAAVALAIAARRDRTAGAAPVSVWARARPSLFALVPLAGPLVVPLVNLAATGETMSATTRVKWLVASPYLHGASLVAAIRAHVALLPDLLNGGAWTAVFVPEHLLPLLAGGALALPFRAQRTRLPYHGLVVAAFALATLVPCTYMSFLWNRVRYLWPFAPAWFVLLACLARSIGDAARRVSPRLTFVAPTAMGLFVGAFATKLPWTLADLAESAHAIDRQQVELGRWAARTLPEDAIVGVNDTGAIAYFGERRTFDVVGLTTRGEATYWAAGAGSRFEHYEMLPAARRPTHFVVYPQWMACPEVLGTPLHSATVTDQSILGGTTMTAFVADYDLLGSGAAPVGPAAGPVLDALDVADLASEAAHGHELGVTSDTQNVVRSFAVGPPDDVGSRIVADGGRIARTRDAFDLRAATPPARLVARLTADERVELAVRFDGRVVGTLRFDPETSPASEAALAIPEGSFPTGARVRVVVEPTTPDNGTFGSFHYWLVGP